MAGEEEGWEVGLTTLMASLCYRDAALREGLLARLHVCVSSCSGTRRMPACSSRSTFTAKSAQPASTGTQALLGKPMVRGVWKLQEE